ncbi:MAG TPA: CHAT domain-containing protein, partial [Pirellulales bacterium]|nr:CHAT domain-containing protein [Pirellulales bacterium]
MFNSVAAMSRTRMARLYPAIGSRPFSWVATLACMVRVAAVGAVAFGVGAVGTANQAFGQGQQFPPPSYFNVHQVYYQGNYLAALNGYGIQAQSAITNGATLQKWIDSICYQTMLGECRYQMGQYEAALIHYNFAVGYYLASPNWLQQVMFTPAAIMPANAGQMVATPWHPVPRAAVIGAYPPYVSIMQGVINFNAVAVQICPQEIVRCTCLAIRRRRELLGPAAPYDKVTEALLVKLAPRPALPNHWSAVWVDAELGMAYAAAGKDKQAVQALKRAELAGGSFEHPLTGMVLLELGRLAMKTGDLVAAGIYFYDATYSAAQYGDFGTMEEAFRLGAMAHLMDGKPVPFLPSAPAILWAKAQQAFHLQASLLISDAEVQCTLDNPALATGELAQAGSAMLHTNMLTSRVGARFNYVTALTSFQSGNVVGGEAALRLAMTFQTGGSLWLYHMFTVDRLWNTRQITDRIALDMFEYVLRDPAPVDWGTDPMESLSSLMVPHLPYLEHWFEATLKQSKEHERALEISDRIRKHRFLYSQEWGGRLLNLRWVLEGPPEVIGQDAMLQRQAMLTRYPNYDKLSTQARKLRADLALVPLAPDDPEVARQQKATLAELTEISVQQEMVLRGIALRREPCELVFPPLRTTEQVQKQLADGEAMLAFISTSKPAWYAFVMTNDKYAHWEIKVSKKFAKDIVSLLQGWGNFNSNKHLDGEDLVNHEWKSHGKTVLDALMKGSKVDLAGLFEELVIVPDGVLWYVPFEALQFSDGDGTKPLLDKLRIRYAPTVGLGVGERRPRRQEGNTAVVVGKLYPQDDAEVAVAEFDKLSHVASGAVSLSAPLPAPPAVYAALFDRLIVLNDVQQPQDGGPYDWAPLQFNRATQGGALSNWFSFPWGGPDQVILPGFHTPAERAFKNIASPSGDDLFLSICGLMSTGARTVLISRWRTGGQTSFNLVREFAQELPHATAAEAWQRSVMLAQESEIDPSAEPRVKLKPNETPPKAENPFFWAGYLLADTGSSPHDPPVDEADNVIVKMDKPAGPRAVGQPAVGEPADQADDVPAAKG